ncbi:MAG TPA: riboflavin synthase [Pseudobdellovibrionaceae bacterium]|nr:riboflavin synthase [Pseudobdellovibrionaceae bacterium]
MFSGIVEAVVPALRGEAKSGLYRLVLRRPTEFTDIKGGDSIAVDGACLTVEEFDADSMTFALAAETLRVLRWNPDDLLKRTYNLERSLRFGDRLHGHLVSGHVDARQGESLFLDVRIPPALRSYVWKKGSLAIHGVSLTINELKDDVVSVCLIPETQKRTNLSKLKVGDSVHLESDMIARAVVRALETGVMTAAPAKEGLS